MSDIEYLDQAAASAPGRDYKRRVLAAMDLRTGLTALDVGCGPGTDLADLAGEVGADGCVIGVDNDAGMLAEAARRMAGHGAVDLRLGDAHALPVAERSVDRARLDRILQHLAEPARALAELRRVVRPGGVVVLADNDWDTLVIDAPDVETSRAYTRYVADRVVRNGAVGRQLGRLAVETGFSIRSVEAVPVVFRDRQAAEQILRIETVTERGLAVGALPEEATRRWLQTLRRGPFLAALTFFITIVAAGVV